MAEVDLPYLWFATGRKGRRYPFYRRAGRLTPITDLDGKRLLGGDFGLFEAYERIHASFVDDTPESDSEIIPGSLRHGIVEFSMSPEFQQLKPNTKKSYNQAFEWLLKPPSTPTTGDNAEDESHHKYKRHKGHGHRPLASMDQEVVISLRDLRYDPPKDMRNKRAHVGVFSSSANALLSALGGLFQFITLRPRKFRLPRGWKSPTEGVPRLKGGDGYRPWEEAEIEQYYDRWPPETIQRAIFDVYLDTGQRGIDVWGMKRKHYRPRKRVFHDATGISTAEREISVVQEKTGARVWIPAADELMPILDRLLKSHSGEWFFVTQAGEHMAHSYFASIVREAIDDAGLPDDCHPHGLRATFATRMIEWGLDHQTIEAIVGHTTMQMAWYYTRKRREGRFAVATMNRGLAAHRAGQELLVDE